MLKFIDIHSHLTDSLFDNQLEKIVNNFDDDGVLGVVNASYDKSSVKKSLEIVKKYDRVFCTLGIHPEDYNDYDNQIEQEIMDNANANFKVVGIGEIGLDYHYISQLPDVEKEAIKEKQKKVFADQLKLAYELKLPVVIHTRDAIGDTLEILKENINFLKFGGVMHCFSESVEIFKIIKKMGLIISIGGVVTFKNAKKLIDVVLNMKMEDFALETDCPYLTPEPYRGKEINQPKYIKYIAEKIAEIKNVSVDEIILNSNNNIKRIFKRIKL